MSNPLISRSELPNQAPLFAQITEDHYLPAIEEGIKAAKAAIADIKSNKSAPDFENTIVALETSSEILDGVTSVFYNQMSAAGTDGIHALAQKIGPITASHSSDIMLDHDLFMRVKSVYDGSKNIHLTPEQRTLLEETYKSFVRSGALLDDSKKQRLREINERLSVLGPEFMNNVMKSSESFTLLIEDTKDLAGLPAGAIDGARQAAEEKGHKNAWLFTLDFPSYAPFIQYADNRSLREKIWKAFNSRAFKGNFDNSPVVMEIVRLKAERARLLGYNDHAHYVLEERMAQTSNDVIAFLDRLKKSYKPAALNDLKALKEFAAACGGPDELQPWDISYYSEKLKQNLFDFNSEDLRPYFPLQTVLKGCFDHFSRLFGLKFEENKSYQVWHSDVTAFDVRDQEDGRFIGTLFTDFFPRTGKKDGAWKTSYRGQGLFHGQVERPVIAIVCNFTKPTKEKPSLLTHGEVLTLFHEMGHAVHGLLSDVTYTSLAGTNVKWDFVELPSQVQENWVYQKETLDLISGHYETGEKIPAALVNKIIESKNFMAGWAGLRQVNFCYLDMAWHSTDPSEISDVASFEDAITSETSLFKRLAGPVSTSFSHLFAGGYGAGYYSYKWAEVLDADTFEFFLERGLYDRKTAQSYRDEILSRGGTEHPRILYARFRGRDADPDSLLRREGLKNSVKAA